MQEVDYGVGYAGGGAEADAEEEGFGFQFVLCFYIFSVCFFGTGVCGGLLLGNSNCGRRVGWLGLGAGIGCGGGRGVIAQEEPGDAALATRGGQTSYVVPGVFQVDAGQAAVA